MFFESLPPTFVMAYLLMGPASRTLFSGARQKLESEPLTCLFPIPPPRHLRRFGKRKCIMLERRDQAPSQIWHANRALYATENAPI